MRRNITALTAALILAIAPVSFVDESRAQGLVEYALILVLVAIAADEIADFHWYPAGNNGRSDANIPQGTIQTFTIVVTNNGPSAQVCRQSIRAEVGVSEGLNRLRVATSGGNDTLLINEGEVSAPLKPCFFNASDLAIELGIPVPPEVAADFRGAGPMPAPPGLNRPFVAATAVRAPDGRTAAVLSYWDAGFVLLDVSDPAGP